MKLAFPCSHNPKAPQQPKELTAGTGACGINCRVCKLNRMGICTSCGSGTSAAGVRKLEAQRRVLGAGCPILECATARKVAYCPRDCDDFPCTIFEDREYPFGKGYIDMQRRRRQGASASDGVFWPETAAAFWPKLEQEDKKTICRASGAESDDDGSFVLPVLGGKEKWVASPQDQTLQKQGEPATGQWGRQMPFLALAYLVHATPPPLVGEMTAPRELYSGVDPFRGKYSLEIADLVSAFQMDATPFRQACVSLGGTAREEGDASYGFILFPKLAVQYILWCGDEELPGNMTILLDRGSPNHLPADATAVAINLLSERILLAATSL